MPLHVRGVVLPEGSERDLYIVDGRITLRRVPDATSLGSGGFVVPGLVDAHAHLALASPVDGELAEQMHASARAHLDAGVLLIRDPGGPGHDAVRVGPEQGLPRVINAGRFLAPHGRYFPGLARELDPVELPIAAAEEARRSGAWAKVIGDFFGPDGRVSPNFALHELQGAADAVHRGGGRITMHAMTAEAIELAIAAGFDCIEHGTEATSDHVAEMARRSMAWVPTLVIGEPIRSTVRGMDSPSDEVQRWDEAVRHLPEAVRHAASAGVRLLAGTDAGMVPHGIVAQERDLLVRAGVDPARALAAASWDARAYFGLPGIEEDAPADLVIFEDDPRADPDVLTRPKLRVLAGQVVDP